MFVLADQIDLAIANAESHGETVIRSILDKAIRGEIVLIEAELRIREGREYEPAAVLLERIRSEKANGAETPSVPKRKLRNATAQVGA